MTEARFRQTLVFTTLTCLVLLLAAALRLYDLNHSLWGDEILTQSRANRSIPEIWTFYEKALYYSAVHSALSLGDSEAVLRFPSVLFGLLGILALFGLAKSANGPAAALTAAVLLACSSYHLRYSQEARYYTLIMLAVLGAAWFLWRAAESGRLVHWAGFALCAWCGARTHLFAFLGTGALAAGAGLWLVAPCTKVTWLQRASRIVLLAVCLAIADGGTHVPKLLEAAWKGKDAIGAPGTPYSTAPAPPADAGKTAALQESQTPDTKASTGDSQSESGIEAVAMDTAELDAETLLPPLAEGEGETAPVLPRIVLGLPCETVEAPETQTTTKLLVTEKELAVIRAQAGDEQAPAPGETHRLSIAQYRAFLNEYFPLPRLIQLALLASAVLGFVILGRMHPCLGFVVAGVVVFPPLPFLLIPAQHFLHDRYFSFQFPFLLLLASIGITASAGWIEQRLRSWMEGRRWPAPPNGGLSSALVAVLLAAISPFAAAAISAQYAARPAFDFKGLAQYLGTYLHPGDSLYFVGQKGDADLTWFPLKHTLSRYYPNYAGAQAWFNLRKSAGIPTAKQVSAFAQRFPGNNVFFIRGPAPIGDAGKTLDSLGIPKRTFGGLAVWTLGRPAVNLIRDGGFEGRDPDRILTKGAEIVEQGEAYEGKRAIRLELDEPGRALARLEVQPVEYRLQNPELEAWSGHNPAGWALSAPDGVRCIAEGQGGIALEFLPGPAAAVARQVFPMGLAPGCRAALSMHARAASGDQLELVLAGNLPGQVFRESTFHPGGGWQTVQMQCEIPENADPESFVIEVIRHPGAGESAAFDDVRLSLSPARVELDPLRPYTLSMMLKYDGVHFAEEYLASDPPNPGQIALSYHDLATKRNSAVELLRFSGSSGWQHLSFRLVPGQNIPTRAAYLKLNVSITRCTGRVWVDNVQFEAGDQPTPFTASPRLPHDERFAVSVSAGKG